MNQIAKFRVWLDKQIDYRKAELANDDIVDEEGSEIEAEMEMLKEVRLKFNELL